jgi:transposase
MHPPAAAAAAGFRQASPDGQLAGLGERDIRGLLFTGEMYGVQLDQLASVLGVGEPRARAIVARWRDRRLAESARLGPGAAWVWLTRSGLAACGLGYSPAPPALGRLAHIRAVTAVRLALESASGYAAAGAYWRSERRLRARAGGRVGLREHLPDGEVHWPSEAAGIGWAGECWAVEAELTRKTVSRTTAIMRELLTRTGDYGCLAADARVPGRPPRHARALYLSGPAALATVFRARDALGSAGTRIQIRALPPGAALPDPARRAAT